MNPEIKTIYSTFNKNLYRITGEGGISDTLNSNNFANTTGYLEVPSDSVGAGVSVSQIDNVGATRFQNVIIGGNTIVISNTDDIQRSIYALGEDGGVVHLKAGTYSVPTGGIVIPASCRLEGDSYKNTILDFTGGGTGISVVGTNDYSTGTVTDVAADGVTVTGSGTSWLSITSPEEKSIFLGTRWYKILSVTDNDTLVLEEGYGDSVVVPAGITYIIGVPVEDVSVTDLTVKSSSGTGLNFQYARNLEFIDVYTTLNQTQGIKFQQVMGITTNRLNCVANYLYGFWCKDSGFGNWTSIPSIANGFGGTGGGYYLDNIKTIAWSVSAADANTGKGITIKNSNDVTMLVEMAGNSGMGIDMDSVNDNIVMIACLVNGNGSDGIKLTATTTNFKIGGSHIANNTGYGINIAASTDEDTVITGNDFANNSSGAINDSGTRTIISGNAGVADNAKIISVPTVNGTATGPTTNSFVSGYTSSAVGDLVYLDSNGKWQKTDADAAATASGMLGIALAVAATDAALLVALPGSFVYSTVFPALTIGAPYYVSTVAGEITDTQPSGTDDVIRVVGFGVHADKLYFNPSDDYVTVV